MKYHQRCYQNITKCRPPRRGAWIEIPRLLVVVWTRLVAPRAGGRGLKFYAGGIVAIEKMSPPAQGGVD